MRFTLVVETNCMKQLETSVWDSLQLHFSSHGSRWQPHRCSVVEIWKVVGWSCFWTLTKPSAIWMHESIGSYKLWGIHYNCFGSHGSRWVSHRCSVVEIWRIMGAQVGRNKTFSVDKIPYCCLQSLYCGVACMWINIVRLVWFISCHLLLIGFVHYCVQLCYQHSIHYTN